MTQDDDPFNPNNWDLSPKICRIYSDDYAHTWAEIDEVDYQWAVQWKWHINKPHPTRNGQKRYFVRSQGRGGNYKPRLYLHVEIMKRTKKRRTSKEHKLVDHKDGNEHNCTRSNLCWVTHKQNNRRRK